MNQIAPPPTTALFAQLKRITPLGLIILAHIAFFHALQIGLPRKASQAVPHEVIASFITPEPAVEAPRPQAQPSEPKTVPVVKKTVTRPTPVAKTTPVTTPVTNTTPSPNAVTAPISAPTPEPAAPASTPAPAAPPAQPKTITSGVEYLQPPRPDYPAAARRMGEEGKAVLRVLINDKGHADRIELQKSSGSPRLDEAAKQAVQRALFKPYMENGKPVAVYAVIPITFQLD